MARYVDAIDLPVPIEAAFAYLADFSRTAEWDPGVVEAERLTPGEPGLGSRFRVVVAFLGRRLTLEYQITAYEYPSRLVLRGEDGSVRSIDEITFVSRPGGTRVTYEARVELSGLSRLAGPVLDLLFQFMGRLAVRGLRERLAGGGPRPGRRAPAASPPAVRNSRAPRKRATSVRGRGREASRGHPS